MNNSIHSQSRPPIVETGAFLSHLFRMGNEHLQSLNRRYLQEVTTRNRLLYVLSWLSFLALLIAMTVSDDSYHRFSLISFQCLIEFLHSTSGAIVLILVLLISRRMTFLVVLLLLYRFYFLNVIPHDFDGEMAGSMAVSTDLWSAVQVNSRQSGVWWNPLGFFYYLFCWLSIQCFGTTLVAIRLVSAITSLISAGLLFLLLRKMFNKDVAFVGALLYAFSPIEMGWGRTDYFAFPYTTLIPLCLLIATYWAIRTNKHIYYAFTMLLMGLSYHNYPSAQVVFIIPVFVSLFYIKEVRWKMLWWLPGILLWLFGLTFCEIAAGHEWRWHNPFTIHGIKTVWGSDMNLVTGIAHNTWELFKHTFIGYKSVTHITPIAIHPPVYIPHAVSLAFLAGLVCMIRKPLKKEYVLLWAWLLVSVLPGILSNQPEARRVTTMFPAIYAIASVPFFRIPFVQWKPIVLSILIPLFAVWQGSAYFKQTPFFPPSVDMAQAIQARLEPDTLIITDISPHYGTRGEVIYLLIDDCMKKHCILYLVDEWNEDLPNVTTEEVRNQWFYQFTRFRNQQVEPIPRRTLVVLMNPPPAQSQLIKTGEFQNPNPYFPWYSVSFYEVR